MAAALVPLQTKTLTSTQTSVVFGSIPASYRDLRIVMNVTGVNTDVAVQFNGDTGANYSRVYMAAQSSGAVSGTGTGSNILFGYVANTDWTAVTLDVMDYSATDKQKTTLSRSSASNILVMAIAGRWASTSAITSVTLTATANSFAIGSTISLYGVVA